MDLRPPDPADTCVCIDAGGNRFVERVTPRGVLTVLIEDPEADRRYTERAIAAGCPVFRSFDERDRWAATVRPT